MVFWEYEMGIGKIERQKYLRENHFSRKKKRQKGYISNIEMHNKEINQTLKKLVNESVFNIHIK